MKIRSGISNDDFAWGFLPVPPRQRNASDGGVPKPAASGGSSRVPVLPAQWSDAPTPEPRRSYLAPGLFKGALEAAKLTLLGFWWTFVVYGIAACLGVM